MTDWEDTAFETRAIHHGQEPDDVTGAVVPPIHLATTFAQDSVGKPRAFEYSRSGNPTRAALETALAGLEGATRGFAFSSGLAATDAVLRQLEPGDHVVLPDDAYGGTYRLVNSVHRRAGITFTTADLTSPNAVADGCTDRTRLVWLETPSNPRLRVIDIAAVAAAAHDRGAWCAVDNTFATPYLQRPLELGADIVVHSTTKYLGGHSDVVGGFVALAGENALSEGIGFVQNATGAVPSPFDCYLVLRGLKTLAVRMDRHSENAARVAQALRTHPAVDAVFYPDGELAAKQMRASGGMVSFTLNGGEDAALRVAAGTRIFTLAESLGAVESLIEHPARMTHASVTDSPLEVDAALIRLSVGLEAADDLIEDLRRVLDGL